MKKTIWLLLSSFGIMFAILSWCQESGLIPLNIGWWKGVGAWISGIILYVLLPSKMGD
jgi:hypothetical protein|tara:strand:+ start:487 stop:660 length:174 start_codon:yes stop_codon:yes gene_type:complete